jgi:hypothetical protein
MKFYTENKSDINYRDKIRVNKLTAVYFYKYSNENYYVQFFKNGEYHNIKNSAYIRFDGYKDFSLNGKFYGYQTNFTKESWRRFVKLQAFL